MSHARAIHLISPIGPIRPISPLNYRPVVQLLPVMQLLPSKCPSRLIRFMFPARLHPVLRYFSNQSTLTGPNPRQPLRLTNKRTKTHISLSSIWYGGEGQGEEAFNTPFPSVFICVCHRCYRSVVKQRTISKSNETIRPLSRGGILFSLRLRVQTLHMSDHPAGSAVSILDSPAPFSTDIHFLLQLTSSDPSARYLLISIRFHKDAKTNPMIHLA
jgi:hypothetical protein